MDGGANPAPSGDGGGTVFKITASGMLTTLYSFCSQSGCADGLGPWGALVQGTNGDLYGTTGGGGTNAAGTIFKITPSGKLTTLYSFCSQSGCTDGALPYAGPVQTINGDLYGTTEYGSSRNCVPKGCGTVFQITPSATLTTLYSFCTQSGCADGAYPHGALMQATNEDFYGTTTYGGSHGSFHGTVFQITPTGTLTTLYSFCAQREYTDGYGPVAGLIQATNGELYDTTTYGGPTAMGRSSKSPRVAR